MGGVIGKPVDFKFPICLGHHDRSGFDLGDLIDFFLKNGHQWSALGCNGDDLVIRKVITRAYPQRITHRKSITITDNAGKGVPSIPMFGRLPEYFRQIDSRANPISQVFAFDVLFPGLCGKLVIDRIQMVTGFLQDGLGIGIKDRMLPALDQFLV